LKKQPKDFPEVIERAVRMASDGASKYSLQWALDRIHYSQDRLHARMLVRWVRQQEVDTIQRQGSTSAEEDPGLTHTNQPP